MTVAEALKIMHEFVYENETAQVKYTYGEIETALKCNCALAYIYSDSFAALNNSADRYVNYYENEFQKR